MADRGFTISDQIAPRGIKLNIQPLMEGRSQLSAEDLPKSRLQTQIMMSMDDSVLLFWYLLV